MPNSRYMKDSRLRRGQGLIEATLVLLVFFALLLGVVDCGQVLFAHQALVERVRSSVRWGTLHPYDGTGEQVANLILYDQIEEPGVINGVINGATPGVTSGMARGTSREGFPGQGFLGMTRANVQVRYQAASPERPDDEMLSVAIVNYESHFFSPWIARKIVSPRPVLISAPMAPR